VAPPQIRVGDRLVSVGPSEVAVADVANATDRKSAKLPFESPLADLVVQAVLPDSSGMVSIVGRTCDELKGDEPLESNCTPGDIVAALFDTASMEVRRAESPVAPEDRSLRTSLAGVPGSRPALNLVQVGDDPPVDRVRIVELIDGGWQVVADDETLRKGFAAIAVEACTTESATFIKVLGSSSEMVAAANSAGQISSDYPRRMLVLYVSDGAGVRRVEAKEVQGMNSELTRIACTGSGAVVTGPNLSGSSVETWAIPDLKRSEEWVKLDTPVSLLAPPQASSTGTGVVLNYLSAQPSVRVIQLSGTSVRTADISSMLNTVSAAADMPAAQITSVADSGDVDGSLTFFGDGGLQILKRDQIEFSEVSE